MWHMLCGEITGRLHRLWGLPCQDQTFALERGGVSAIALADGAGSKKLSLMGASCAVRTACELLCDEFDRFMRCEKPLQMRRRILDAVRAGLREQARNLEAAVDELACTLLAVAVRGDEYLLFHAGDGVIAARKSGRLLLASAPQNGEFANATTFVTSPSAIQLAKVMRGRQPGLEGFALMSDGSQSSLFCKRGGRLAPLLDTLLARAEILPPRAAGENLEAILAQVLAKRTGDDCSLALLTRKTDGFGHWEKLTQRERAALLGIRTQKHSRVRRQIRRRARALGLWRIQVQM